jgi:hypothetical protein
MRSQARFKLARIHQEAEPPKEARRKERFAVVAHGLFKISGGASFAETRRQVNVNAGPKSLIEGLKSF